MPTTPTTPTARRAAPLATVLLASALLAGPSVAPAAAARHAPCPTAGTTVAKGKYPTTRVYRQGTALRACVKKPGQRRIVRTLGTWTSATKAAAGAGSVAWTTSHPSPDGPVDSISALDVRRGTRWYTTSHVVPAPGAATPASDGVVQRLLTDDHGVSWITTGGAIGAGVRHLGDEQATLQGDGPATPVFRSGRTYFVTNVPAASAATIGAGLQLALDGDGDECGGVTWYQLKIPAYGVQAAQKFTYAWEDFENPHCGV